MRGFLFLLFLTITFFNCNTNKLDIVLLSETILDNSRPLIMDEVDPDNYCPVITQYVIYNKSNSDILLRNFKSNVIDPTYIRIKYKGDDNLYEESMSKGYAVKKREPTYTYRLGINQTDTIFICRHWQQTMERVWIEVEYLNAETGEKKSQFLE